MTVWDTPERLALRSLARDVATRELVPHLPDWERAMEVPREVHKQLAEAGLLGIGFPEEVGGQGGDAIDVAIVSEEIIAAGGSSGLLAALFTHGIGIPHIARSGSAELVDRFVRPTLAGDLIAALGVTEPGGGSDVAGITTRAVRDGDHWVINGAKTYITSGVRSDFVTTAVRTGEPGFGGISLIVVEKGTPGFTVGRALEKTGWWCSDTAELSYVDVRVPDSHVIAGEGNGFKLIMEQFQSERLGLAVHAYATAARCLDLTIQWVKDRETFGKSLSSRQLVRHRIARMARQVDVARTYTRSVLERHAAGENVLAEVAMAKNQAIECVDAVTYDAVQLHGGLGYMRESEVERHSRDARLLAIGGGTTEIMDEILAKLLGL